MKLLKTDRLVPLVTISLAALFSFMLYADFTRQSARSSADEVGILTYEKRVAERRYADEVVWESIDKDAKVYNCDYLRTAAGSGAIVRLKDGTDIEMDADTLVLVCRSRQGLNIDLDRGSIAARKKPSGRTMKIATRFGSVDVRNGVLGLGVSKKGLSMNVSSGSAEVTAGGKTEKVDRGYSASVRGTTIEKGREFARQVAPDINTYYVLAGETQRVNFSWETDAGTTAILQVAKDPAFAIMAGKEEGEKRASLELPAGTYYWRLADEAGRTGSARMFTIVRDRPAIPRAPAQSEQLSAGRKGPLVRFAWEPAAAASSYTIEIARDPRFRNMALSLESDTGSIAAEGLTPGSYYWRIRNNYGFPSDAALVSVTRQFSIVKAGDMAPPEPLVPVDGGTIPDISISTGKALFNWKSDAGYAGYELTIARDGGFKRIAYSETTSNNFHKPAAALEKGTYFWRVRGMTGAGDFSTPSGPFKFTVTGAAPPVLTAPGSNAVVYPDGSEKLLFRWSGPNGGHRYRFELSSDREFKKILKENDVTGLVHAMSMPETGAYFWRVKLVDSAGRLLVSEPRAIAIMKSLQTPGGVSPTGNEAVEITSRKGMLFTWDPVEGATHYQVTVKRVVGGKEKEIFTTRVAATRYQFTKTELLDAGSFLWEIAAIRQKGKEAELTSTPGKNYFTIKPGKRLSAPELKSRVLYVK